MLTELEQSQRLSGIRECNSLCVVIPPESDLMAGENAEAVRSEIRRAMDTHVKVDEWLIGLKRVD